MASRSTLPLAAFVRRLCKKKRNDHQKTLNETGEAEFTLLSTEKTNIR